MKYVRGGIGGHCLIPNAELLNKIIKDNLSEFVLRINEEYKKEL